MMSPSGDREELLRIAFAGGRDHGEFDRRFNGPAVNTTVIAQKDAAEKQQPELHSFKFT
jgi:hypothetical protein